MEASNGLRLELYLPLWGQVLLHCAPNPYNPFLSVSGELEFLYMKASPDTDTACNFHGNYSHSDIPQRLDF